MLFLQVILIAVTILTGCTAVKPCVERYYNERSFVCVCNATYCDIIETFDDEDLQNGSYAHYESNMKDKRLHLTIEKFSTQEQANTLDQIWNFLNTLNVLNYFFSSSGSFTVDSSKKYQDIFGIGGAITDSVGFLLKGLPIKAQDQILRQYFGDTGLNYSFIRIPLGCSDYSPRLYSYDDNGEGKSLANFSLTEEEYKYKLPVIKKAQNFSTAPIKIIAAPWIAPQRMLEPRYYFFCRERCKKLKPDYYSTYAEYIIKFLDAYKEEGIDIWGVSTQNEPFNGFVGILYPTNLGWSPWEQGEWISKHLGPYLNSSGYDDVNVIIFDDQRKLVAIWPYIVMSYAKEFVSGIAIHAYLNMFVPAFFMDIAHFQFPDLFIISTEFSITHDEIFDPSLPAVRLGNWENLESYVSDILENFNNHVNGWIDWNIVLDDEGGPSFSNTSVDSPIIVSDDGQEYYKQPMWYGIGHISRFVPPGSKRVDLQGPLLTFNVDSAAFETPENRVVIVMLNKRDSLFEANINVGNGSIITLKMSPRSVHTVIYNKFT